MPGICDASGKLRTISGAAKESRDAGCQSGTPSGRYIPDAWILTDDHSDDCPDAPRSLSRPFAFGRLFFFRLSRQASAPSSSFLSLTRQNLLSRVKFTP